MKVNSYTKPNFINCYYFPAILPWPHWELGLSLGIVFYDLVSRLSKEGLGSRILHQTHHFLILGQPLITSITIIHRNQPLYSIRILHTSFWKESTKLKIVQFSKHWDLAPIHLPVITTDKSWWCQVLQTSGRFDTRYAIWEACPLSHWTTWNTRPPALP